MGTMACQAQRFIRYKVLPPEKESRKLIKTSSCHSPMPYIISGLIISVTSSG